MSGDDYCKDLIWLRLKPNLMCILGARFTESGGYGGILGESHRASDSVGAGTKSDLDNATDRRRVNILCSY